MVTMTWKPQVHITLKLSPDVDWLSLIGPSANRLEHLAAERKRNVVSGIQMACFTQVFRLPSHLCQHI